LKVVGKITLNAKTALAFIKKHPDRYSKDAELPGGKWSLNMHGKGG
jgi:hypothetical protein